MNYAEARHQLLLHGPGTADAAGQPLILEDGFVSCLRPYIGLQEKNFHLVMEALLTVGEGIHGALQVDRDVVQAVWSICSTGRDWGLHRGGMLQRNKLITAADTARLELWVETIEGTALRLLGGCQPHRAVVGYADYIVSVGWWTNVAFFIPLMERAVSDPELMDAIEGVVDALGKLGGLATSALPTLHEARRRLYTWYTPEDRCTEEVRACIGRAIQAIEHAGGGEPRLSAPDS
ncbi:MAG: hypothetical protein JWO38_6791 [Gemmataceae bacterium]|nr:hypothetical protein [Gemmataceae bacterium]